jgi:hypothetical protein
MKVTDGRRAEVEFTKDWKLDANREREWHRFSSLSFQGCGFRFETSPASGSGIVLSRYDVLEFDNKL